MEVKQMFFVVRTEPSTRHEPRHMNENENKPADKDAPRGMSDEVLDGNTLDLTVDPAKKEEEPLEPLDDASR
jgi:hypothetical protein